MVDFFAHAIVLLGGVGFGAFQIWWGMYAIRNKKMMWFTKNSKAGYFEEKSRNLGLLLIAFGILSIISALGTLQ